MQKEREAVIDIDAQYREDAKQYYTFDLLTPNQYHGWIADLKKGLMHDLLTSKVRVRT